MLSVQLITIMQRNRIWLLAFTVCILIHNIVCYEKTLRKIVRNQSKMIQRPFSETLRENNNNYSQLKDYLIFPGYSQVNTAGHKIQRPKVSTVLSSMEKSRNIYNKPTYSRKKMNKNNYQNELRLTRNTFANISESDMQNMHTPLQRKNNILFPDHESQFIIKNFSQSGEVILEEINKIPSIPFFPPINKIESFSENSLDNSTLNSSEFDDLYRSQSGYFSKNRDSFKIDIKKNQSVSEYEIELDEPDLLEDSSNFITSTFSQNSSITSKHCINLAKSKADLDAQEKFLELDIEPERLEKNHFWNKVYDNRYEFLMRNPDWPPLKVILIPRTHVDAIWLKPFESYHNETVQKIITNVIKKLQFYQNLTFAWNEVSHLSYWWKKASQKRRMSLRRLIREGRLEITTGGWVETDEATSSLFGILHQFIEGHQWLDQYLNCRPKVAWLTNSVTHSPTFPYILSSMGITNLVFTNVHFSLEQYFAEYQYSDFIWVQQWDSDKTMRTDINQALNKIGKDKYPKHSVLTHYLQFNSDDFKACGPQSKICEDYFNFANKITDINTYNVKNKAETLLEQYSKTGTLSPHNIIIAPLGGPAHYETPTEFDYQYNNYLNIADFINVNQNIYKATVQFGTPKDYFTAIAERHKSYPTLTGDFLNFAEINNNRPAYWSGYFTTRPKLKILLRRLQATLRSTDILVTFTSSFNAFRGANKSELFIKLSNVREIVALLQDRNIISGTLSANMLKNVYNQILAATKDCWYIQEVVTSLLSSKPEHNEKYLMKYVYREGEFISTFKSIEPGDQLYIFNSLSQERTEIVDILTRNINIRVIDHNNKDVTFQVNPVWKYSSTENIIRISGQFFKIIFQVVVPPMTLKLFKFKETFDMPHSISNVYCMPCTTDKMSGSVFFNIQPIEPGDIQIENYKLRLIFDEYTGFLKTVIEKETNNEKQVLINYGAFKSSNTHSGIYLFNTNSSKPFYNILKPYRKANKEKKMIIIVSGNVVSDFTIIYDNFLQHTVRICNILNNPLLSVIRIESKVDFEVSPKNRDLEIFITVQTDIANGNPPEIYLDNNGYQFTSRKLNISRRIESNMYPITSMVYIQDEKSRLTIVTDHAQGVTALQEGQILVMLDRRVLFDDGLGVDEGLADSSATNHVHYILLENFKKIDETFDMSTKPSLVLPSLLALQMANILTYPLDIFFIDQTYRDLCYYIFLPLVRSSFPCDVSVINFRMLLKRGFVSKTTLNSAILTLHRQSFTCKVYGLDHFYCSENVSFSIERIFQHVKSVFHTNLVGTNKGIPVSTINVMNFPSMELMTLKITF